MCRDRPPLPSLQKAPTHFLCLLPFLFLTPSKVLTLFPRLCCPLRAMCDMRCPWAMMEGLGAQRVFEGEK